MHGHNKVNDFSTFQFDDDQDVDLGEEKCELDTEIEGPDGGCVILEKRAPLLISTRRLWQFDPVAIHGARRVIYAKQQVQHPRDTFATVVRMIGGNAANELDVFLGNGRSADVPPSC